MGELLHLQPQTIAYTHRLSVMEADRDLSQEPMAFLDTMKSVEYYRKVGSYIVIRSR